MADAIWMVVVLAAGAFLPVQAGLNAKLGRAGASPVHATLVSFAVGLAALAVYLAATRQTVSWSGMRTAPVHAWCGGLLGACYLTAVILAFPRLGPGVTFGLAVAGQMAMSAVLEQGGWLVARQIPLNGPRLFGMALVVAGVVLLRRF